MIFAIRQTSVSLKTSYSKCLGHNPNLLSIQKTKNKQIKQPQIKTNKQRNLDSNAGIKLTSESPDEHFKALLEIFSSK